MDKKFLITGAGSGIGRYLHEQLGGVGFTRQSNNLEDLKRQTFDAIIHCAWNHMPTREVTNDNIGRYFDDNSLLTQELLKIPHKYFVLFSTIDIYPPNDQLHLEDEVIYADSIKSIHGTTKLISEALVRAKAKRYLILRPTSLLGSYMRKNNILKIINDPNPLLSLDSSSVYNLIHYPDVMKFINSAIDQGESGVFNLASANTVTLARIAGILGKKVIFGNHHYEAGHIANNKATKIWPTFGKSSEEILKEFISQNKNIGKQATFY